MGKHDTDVMPCGHTKAQAQWLGCDEDGNCRPNDAKLDAAYKQWVKMGRPKMEA